MFTLYFSVIQGVYIWKLKHHVDLQVYKINTSVHSIKLDKLFNRPTSAIVKIIIPEYSGKGTTDI